MGDLNSATLRRRDGARIALQCRSGTPPTIVFLPGYASDMEGTKARALDDWAARSGRAFVRFDYGGCGASDGSFEAQTLVDWLGDALAVIDAVDGPVILVGSSMGGWLALQAALARPARVAALVGVAAAPDFTDWGYSDNEKAAIIADGRIEQPSDYGAPMVTTRALWESGQALRVLDDRTIAIDCPMRLLQGQRDPDVPWRLALDLAERIRSDDVRTILIKDGDHRLSRTLDIAQLIAAVEDLSG